MWREKTEERTHLMFWRAAREDQYNLRFLIFLVRWW